MESRFTQSNAARLVTQALTASAGALMLGYSWKGASAIYHTDGIDSASYDEMRLYVYYNLTDFGPYIGWFGVTVAAGTIAWMSFHERALPRWTGIFSCVPVIAVVAITGGTGPPGFPGVTSQIWMVKTFLGLGFTRLPERA